MAARLTIDSTGDATFGADVIVTGNCVPVGSGTHYCGTALAPWEGMWTDALVVSGDVATTGALFINDKDTDIADGAAIPLTTHASLFATGGAETSTLAAGGEGQIKVLAMHTDGGDMVTTVTNAGWKSSGTGTITFDTIGDSCVLQYLNSKWFCIANNGAAFA